MLKKIFSNAQASSGHTPSLSPTINRKFGEFKLGSPPVKRKPANDDAVGRDNVSKLKKNENLEKNLNEELVLMYKTRKNKDKMPSLIQQTFVYRRSVIENNNSNFQDIMDQFSYLTDLKNVKIDID
jgi:hypothetical protein